MKIKKEYVALVVIIVALSLYLVFQNTDKTHYELPELEKIDTEMITQLVISRGDSALTLKRQDEVWKIGPRGYPADQSVIDRMLGAVADFELTSLVSQSRNYVQYELTDDTKIGLDIFTRDGLAMKFDIGKTASTYNHTYIRLENDAGVYQAKGNIRNTFDTDIERLHDKSVLSVAREGVTGLSLAGSGDSFTILKSELMEPVDVSEVVPAAGGEEPAVGEPAAQPRPEPSWRTDDGSPIDGNAIDRMINQFTNLRCDGFIYGKSKEDLGQPVFTVSVMGTEQAELSIFEKWDDDKYPAVSSQSNFPFLLSKWKAEQIMKEREDLVKEDSAE